MMLKCLSYVLHKITKPWRYSLLLAYILYFIGGIFGLHLIYLRRYRHAFVSFTTLGGGCMLGLIYDVFHVSSYVNQANELRFHKKIDNHHKDENTTPHPDILMIICQIFYSTYLGAISLSIFPREFTLLHSRTFLLFQALCVGFGSHTAANSGNARCALKPCMMGAFLPVPLFIFADSVSLGEALLYCSVVSAVLAYFTGWRKLRPEVDNAERYTLLRVLCCFMAYFFFLGVLSQMVIWNVHYTNGEGRRVSLGGEVEDNAEEWQAWSESMWRTLKEEGGWEFILKLAQSPDVSRAHKILGLSSNATQKEISEQYKKLVKVWHPDKFAKEDPHRQRKAERQFMMVREAYEQLREV